MEHLVNVACVSVPIVNDNPLNDLGYTHAPQTFYVSTKGYGILVNTARYTTFLCGSNQKIRQNARSTEGNKNKIAPQLSGEILPQRKLPRTITLRNISSEIGLIKYIFDVASFEEDLSNRV